MYGQNHLARNSQVQAARARLAQRQGRVPGGSQQANMAACGVGAVFGGAPVRTVDSPYGGGIVVPPGMEMNPGSTIVRRSIPLTTMAQTSAATTIVEVFTTGNAVFVPGGLSSCNNCFEVTVQGQSGGLGIDVFPVAADAGLFNTDDCFCPMEMECFNNTTPFVWTFNAMGTPSVYPVASMALWGDWLRTWNECGPYMPVGGFQYGGGSVGGGYCPPNGNGGGGYGAPGGGYTGM